MFHFPGFTSQLELRSQRFTLWGFPIRRSPDRRLLGTSPKLIAATLRPSSQFEPRHPPYALNFLLGNLKTIFYLFHATHQISIENRFSKKQLMLCDPSSTRRKNDNQSRRFGLFNY
jgi:hypothetical protein